MSNECPKCGSKYTHLNRRLGLWECEECGHCFDGESTPATQELGGQAARKVAVFLSYPQGARRMAVMIRDALRTRGHDVWFDEERIREGDDWRASIAEGIETHRIFVSCLTRDAVRGKNGTRGACLDELSIATGTPGCIVHSVLLEPVDVVRPRAPITPRQWLDMSDWREMEEEGAGRFCAWFSERMLRLFEVVESEEPRAFVGELEEVRRLLPLARLGMGREGLLTRPLVGRDWIVAELERGTNKPTNKTSYRNRCVLWGGPGVGKSSFAVHYAMESDSVAAAVCLSHGDVRYGTMNALAQSVAYQLACSLPDYRVELLRTLRGKPVFQSDPFDVEELLFRRPFSFLSEDEGHEVTCLIIDGLDECEDCDFEAVFDLLDCIEHDFPCWLRLFIMARPKWRLNLEFNYYFELQLRDEGGNMDDILAYLEGRLADIVPDAAERGDVVKRIAKCSQGVFLFAEAVSESARLGGPGALDPASLPSTLDEALCGWLEKAFPDENKYFFKFSVLIGAILGSPSPLPEAELALLLGDEDDMIEDLRLSVGDLLERGEDDFGEPTLSVANQYVAEWLASSRSGRFEVCPHKELQHLALECYRIAVNCPEYLTGYEAANAIALCEATGLKSQASELRRNHALAGRLLEYGGRLDASGRLVRARGLYGLAREILEACASRLDMPEVERDLSALLDRVGDVARTPSDLGAAADAWDRSLAIRESLASESDAVEDRCDLAEFLDRSGEAALRRGDLDAAADAYARSLAIRESLVSKLVMWEERCDLAASLDGVVKVALRRGDFATADDAGARSRVVRDELAMYVSVFDDMLNFYLSLWKVEVVALRRGDRHAVGDAYGRITTIEEELKKLDLEYSDLRDFFTSLMDISSLALECGDLGGAAEVYDHLLEIFESYMWEISDYEDVRDLSISFMYVSLLALERGDSKTGESTTRTGRRLFKSFREIAFNPDKWWSWRDLSMLYLAECRLGILLGKVSICEAASDAYAHSLDVLENRFFSEFPWEFLDDLSILLMEAGRLESTLGNRSVADLYSARSREIRENLDEGSDGEDGHSTIERGDLDDSDDFLALLREISERRAS